MAHKVEIQKLILEEDRMYLQDRQDALHGTILTESLPSMDVPSVVMPLRTPSVSPHKKPVSSAKKWQTRSFNPSPLISSPGWLQKARLSPYPVCPKVRESYQGECRAPFLPRLLLPLSAQVTFGIRKCFFFQFNPLPDDSREPLLNSGSTMNLR